ncbi:hypothetical protein RIEGSTA812A_PEG_246 [invertebrate metagenome]|uniref:Uncharacterized protein n=1 Tax=invertebrate metagenome TaxID=1711999 RepID=A0A484H7X0_9ZZZZ
MVWPQRMRLLQAVRLHQAVGIGRSHRRRPTTGLPYQSRAHGHAGQVPWA